MLERRTPAQLLLIRLNNVSDLFGKHERRIWETDEESSRAVGVGRRFAWKVNSSRACSYSEALMASELQWLLDDQLRF